MDGRNTILACDGIEKSGIDILKEHFDVEEKEKVSEDELCELLSSGRYTGIVVRSATKITRKVIEKAKGLKVIGRAGIGVDNIDVVAATERGILVMNTLGAAMTTAEHTIALIFAVARRIPQAHLSMKQKKWEKNKFVGREIYGKTIGIIGLGNIGKKVAEISKALGMKVIFYDPYVEDPRFEKVSFENLIETADIITVHVPLTEKTKGMIGEEELKRMKDGVILINCARGGIIDEKALAKYLKEGKVWGAGVDVFSQEPPKEDNPLFETENTVLTPHIGASTIEGQKNVSCEIAQKIVRYLKYGTVEDAVNFLPVPEEKKAFLELAEKLGSFLAQAYPYPIREIRVSTSLDDISIVKAGALNGILKNIVGEEWVSPLNAETMAKNKGIAIAEQKLTDDKNKIEVQIRTSEGVFSIGGILLSAGAGKAPRIIEINSLQLEAPASGNIIFLQNKDVPGVLGRIGVYLGENNINIASIHLGREKPGGKAVALINVDEEPSPKVIEELQKIPNVIRAVFIKL